MTVTTDLPSVTNHPNLRAVYAHLHTLDTESDTEPTPFPTVHFSTSDGELPYTFTPAVHRLDQSDVDTHRRTTALVGNHSNIDITSCEGYPIRITHHAWTPQHALDVTALVLDGIYDVSLSDLTHVELRLGTSDECLSWNQFPVQE